MKLSMNRDGYAAVFICIMMPLILAIAGICIDGTLLLYYEARLASATKFAAISATAFYEVEDGNAVLKEGPAEAAAEAALYKNFSDAVMVDFIINDERKSECTVKARADVEFFFARIFNVGGTTIDEVFTAERILKEAAGD